MAWSTRFPPIYGEIIVDDFTLDKRAKDGRQPPSPAPVSLVETREPITFPLGIIGAVRVSTLASLCTYTCPSISHLGMYLTPQMMYTTSSANHIATGPMCVTWGRPLRRHIR